MYYVDVDDDIMIIINIITTKMQQQQQQQLKLKSDTNDPLLLSCGFEPELELDPPPDPEALATLYPSNPKLRTLSTLLRWSALDCPGFAGG